MMRIALGTVGAILAAGMCASAAQAQSTAPASGAAAKVNVSMCIGCHGVANYRTAFPEVYHVPKIAGQSQQYLVKALQAYRSGERSHPSMQGIAKSMSDQEIAALAAYYGGSVK
jgi:cytochrome c553